MTIRLNGDPFELPERLTLTALLERLEVDPRRVAVELNLEVVKRALFASTWVEEGDEVEIVNFVGGGSLKPGVRTEARQSGPVKKSLSPPRRV